MRISLLATGFTALILCSGCRKDCPETLAPAPLRIVLNTVNKSGRTTKTLSHDTYREVTAVGKGQILALPDFYTQMELTLDPGASTQTFRFVGDTLTDSLTITYAPALLYDKETCQASFIIQDVTVSSHTFPELKRRSSDATLNNISYEVAY